jgi:hypothetical protein
MTKQPKRISARRKRTPPKTSVSARKKDQARRPFFDPPEEDPFPPLPELPEMLFPDVPDIYAAAPEDPFPPFEMPEFPPFEMPDELFTPIPDIFQMEKTPHQTRQNATAHARARTVSLIFSRKEE